MTVKIHVFVYESFSKPVLSPVPETYPPEEGYLQHRRDSY